MLTKVSETRKGVTLIEIEGKTFVSGLYWQILTNPNAVMAEARAFARKERERTGEIMDVVSIRRIQDVTQAGFVVREAGAKKGMYSLATVACDILGASFVAAFDLGNDRYATVACQRGAIIPDSDAVYDAEGARRATQELWRSLSGSLENGELRLYAPQSIVADGEAVTLEELLVGLNRSQRLRQLSWFSSRELVVLGAFIVVCSASLWAISTYLANKAEKARLEQERKVAEIKRLREESGMDASELALLHPWSSQPRASVFAGLCTQALWSLPLTLDGWVLSSAICTTASTTANYKRTVGRTVEGFRTSASAWRSDLRLTFVASGEAVDIVWSLPMQAGGDDPLVPFSDVSEALTSALQRQFVSVELVGKPSQIASNYQPSAAMAELPLATPNWKTGVWSIKTTSRTPSAFLANLPENGLRITSISLSFQQNGDLAWSAAGEIYGK